MKVVRWVPAVVLCLVGGSILSPVGALAEQDDSGLGAQAKAAPTCMKQSTYKAIKKNMTYAKVKDITKGQKPALKVLAGPYFIYEGCAWTDGKGVLLTYHQNTLDPLRKARLSSKKLNVCGLVPVCA